MTNQCDKEIWIAIKGYETLYEVSNQGRIRSLMPSNSHRLNKKVNPNLMAPNIIKSGYCYIHLCKDGKRKSIQIHRLVGEHFLNKNGKNQINHKDGNKLNNTAENLEWVTRSENTRHAFATGLMTPDMYAKITRNIANQIRSLYPKYNQPQLSKKFNISQSQVGRILRNVCWKENLVSAVV